MSDDTQKPPEPQRPNLTYFVELAGEKLRELLARPGVLGGLRRSHAACSVAMLDLDEARVEALRTLQDSGVPLTAWLVLGEREGYWLTADNVALVGERYRQVRDWLRGAGIAVQAVGLDLEPPHDDARAIVEQGRAAMRRMLGARRSKEELERAGQACAALVAEIRGDGYRVEAYQFPVMLDERRAGSTLLQRTLGVIDVAADREVLMLYESLLPPLFGEPLIDTYGPEAQAIALGVTGGGVAFLRQIVEGRRLTLERLLLGLRRARRYTPHLYVFSLEGCVEAGYFDALCDADLCAPAAPAVLAGAGVALRGALRLLLRGEELFDCWTGGPTRKPGGRQEER